MPSLKLEEIELVSVIKDTIHLFGDEEAEIKFKSELAKLCGINNSQMRRMFINLIRNSIQAKASNINIDLSLEDSYCIINILIMETEFLLKFRINIWSKLHDQRKRTRLRTETHKRFLENTNGEIKLISSKPTGTVFRIKIPAKSSTVENWYEYFNSSSIKHLILEINFLNCKCRLGKNFCTCSKILEIIINTSTPLSRVAAITFTEKAAGELYKRISEELNKLLLTTSDGELRNRIEKSVSSLSLLKSLHSSFCIDLLREFRLKHLSMRILYR